MSGVNIIYDDLSTKFSSDGLLYHDSDKNRLWSGSVACGAFFEQVDSWSGLVETLTNDFLD